MMTTCFLYEIYKAVISKCLIIRSSSSNDNIKNFDNSAWTKINKLSTKCSEREAKNQELLRCQVVSQKVFVFAT